MKTNKPLNIVFAIPALGGGGAERVVLNLCRGLQQYENAQCHIVCFSAKREYAVPSDTDVRICPLPPKTLFGYRKRCAQVLDDFILQNFGRPDAVFANITQTVKCLRYSRLPVVNILHFPPSVEYLGRRKGLNAGCVKNAWKAIIPPIRPFASAKAAVRTFCVIFPFPSRFAPY